MNAPPADAPPVQPGAAQGGLFSWLESGLRQQGPRHLTEEEFKDLRQKMYDSDDYNYRR